MQRVATVVLTNRPGQMSKTILIRDLSEDQQEKLEKLKEHFGEKTSSKIVQALIDKYMNQELLIKTLKVQMSESTRKQRAYENFFKTVKRDIAETNLELNDDDDEYYD